MKSNAKELLGCALLALLVALTACGILNLGPTAEDGAPKNPVEARLILRSFGDAAIQTWGTDAIKKKAPHLMEMFDSSRDGVLTLAEIEGAVNTEDPASLTSLLVLSIEMYRARPR